MSSVAPVRGETVVSWASSSPQEHEQGGQQVTNGFSIPSLVTSPYTDKEHLLDLSTVNVACQILARALAVMKAIRTDYATAPYTEAFNWAEVVNEVRGLTKSLGFNWTGKSFYVVVFRSRIPPSTDRSHLSLLDRKSHEEAVQGGGLLKYWFGVPDADGRNLATCIWRDLEDARRGSSGRGHRRASMATKGLYLEWYIERLCLSVHEGAEDWTISEWQD